MDTNREYILFIGDVHQKIPSYINLIKTKIKEYSHPVKSIQLGDFGLREDYQWRNSFFLNSDILEEDHHLFFGGNHDEYSYLPDFHIGNFGRTPFINAFFIRGARSIDEDQRIHGYDKWDEEELNWAQAKECVQKYEEVKPKIVLSHDGPLQAVNKIFDKYPFKSTTTKLLSTLFDIHEPRLWVFGHWHQDEYGKVNNTHFFCLDELSFFEFEKVQGVYEFDIERSIEENVKKNKRRLF